MIKKKELLDFPLLEFTKLLGFTNKPDMTLDVIEQSKKHFSGFKDLEELKQEFPAHGLGFSPDIEDNK